MKLIHQQNFLEHFLIEITYPTAKLANWSTTDQKEVCLYHRHGTPSSEALEFKDFQRPGGPLHRPLILRSLFFLLLQE